MIGNSNNFTAPQIEGFTPEQLQEALQMVEDTTKAMQNVVVCTVPQLNKPNLYSYYSPEQVVAMLQAIMAATRISTDIARTVAEVAQQQQGQKQGGS